MKTKGLLWLILLLAGGLTACSGINSTPTPSPIPPTPTATETATPTIVWFPPTDTPMPLPTRTLEPTPDFRPAQGALLLTDAFENESSWLVGSYPYGNAAVIDGKLNLSLQQPESFIYTQYLSPEIYDNVYLSVDAAPSLCRGEDAYGILFRFNSQYDYYRYLIRCDGYARVERVRSGQTVLMQDWVFTGVNTGALGQIKLGIWAYQNEMRFFVNDYYLYTANDPVFPSGQVGFFARTADEGTLSVRFSDLTLRALVPAEVPPTPTWTPAP